MDSSGINGSEYYARQDNKAGNVSGNSEGFQSQTIKLDLTSEQQGAADGLWDWVEQSKESRTVFGGTIPPERRALLNEKYGNSGK